MPTLNKIKINGVEYTLPGGGGSGLVNSVNGKTGVVVLTTSDLSNDSGFITKSVNNLTNYYLKTETYTKTEVDNLIGSISTISFEVVQTLPQTGESNVIYLVPKSTAQTNNIYDEYIYTNNAWEKIGDTEIDLSNYYTKSQTYSKTETDTLLGNKVDKVTGKGLSTEDYTSAEKTKLSGIEPGAEVNQNAYSEVQIYGGMSSSIPSVVMQATSETSPLKIIPGSGISITQDSTETDKLRISTNYNGFKAFGHIQVNPGHTPIIPPIDADGAEDTLYIEGTGAVTLERDAQNLKMFKINVPVQQVVSTTADGLCPQLPNETLPTTNQKYLRQDGSWAVPAGQGGGGVSGVKGNSESTYRTGNVNLTSANIGAIDASNPIIDKHTLTIKDEHSGASSGNYGALIYHRRTDINEDYPPSGETLIGEEVTILPDLISLERRWITGPSAFKSYIGQIYVNDDANLVGQVLGSSWTAEGNLINQNAYSIFNIWDRDFQSDGTIITTQHILNSGVEKDTIEIEPGTGIYAFVNETTKKFSFGVSCKDLTPSFTQASTRANIESYESLPTLFGKIQKWYADLKTVAFSGSYADLSNKPTLATVATSGSYNDLSNKPTIPTVNNATLTIQKNGTNVETFTANSSTNKTANITVPTKTSDLTNDSGYVKAPVVLWTNSSPDDTFAARTVYVSGVNINDFRFYEIIFKSRGNFSNNDQKCKSTGLIPINTGASLQRNFQYSEQRDCNAPSYHSGLNETSFTFSACVRYTSYGSSTTSNQNGICVPYKIIGHY